MNVVLFFKFLSVFVSEKENLPRLTSSSNDAKNKKVPLKFGNIDSEPTTPSHRHGTRDSSQTVLALSPDIIRYIRTYVY